MDKIIKKGKQIFFSPQSSVISAATTIMLMIVASRILGLVRQRVLAHFFVPEDLSLFFAAFRLPDLIFEVLVFGTFSSAFIPVFTKSLKKGESEAWDTAARVVNIGLIIFIPLALIFSFKADLVYSYMAPGFTLEQTHTIAAIARVLFAAQAFFVVSYVLTGVLESLRIFLVPALAPVFYNLGIILGLVILVPLFGVLGLAWGVLLGAVLHLFVQLPALKATKFKWQPIWRWTAAEAKILKLMIPRTMGIAGETLSLLVLTALASTMAQGTNALLYYADNIRALPMGIIGVAFSVAAFPLLSAKAAQANLKDFSASLMASVRQVLFWVIPLTVALYLLRAHLVRLVIGTDQLTWDPTILAIAMVGAFAFTIIFQALVPLLAKAFYAFKNTWLPVTAAILGSGLTAGSAFWFAAELKARLPWTLILADILRVPQMPDLTPLALPLALGAGVVLQVIILVTALKIKLAKIDGIWTFFQSIIKTITATVAMAIALYLTRNFLAPLATDPDLRTTVGLFFQASFAAIAGAAAFVLVSWGLESKELQELKRILPWTKKSIDPAQEK